MATKLTTSASFTASHPSGHLIVRHQDDWCVMSSDGEHVLKRATSREEAVAWADERFKAKHARGVVLRGAISGEIRTAEYRGKTHLVAPIVALIGDIAIWPINAPSPELVTLEALAVAPAGWNGRPVCHGHPEFGGEQISANDPETLEATAFGHVFNAKLVGNRLSMEVWVDAELAEKIGAEETYRRLEANEPGDPVEVSVGCFVVAELKAGVDSRGIHYEYVWVEIVPDHLALLPKGQIGACSVADGCGAPRMATVHMVTAQGLEWTDDRQQQQKKEGVMAQTAEGEKKVAPIAIKRSLRERAAAVIATLGSSLKAKNEDVDSGTLVDLYGGPEGYARRLVTGEEMSDTDLRMRLYDALRAVQPGFAWVEDVFPESKQVIYCADPDGMIVTMRRSYAVAEDNTVTVSENAEVVERVTTYEPVTAATTKAEKESGKVAEATAASADCGCKGRVATAQPADGKEKTMSIAKEKVTALISNPRTPWAETDRAYLEGLSAERFAEVEQHAAAQVPGETPEPKKEIVDPAAPAVQSVAAPTTAAAKPLSEDEWMKLAPAPVRSLVERAQREEATRRSEIITRLSAAQSQYTEAELKAMQTSELEKIDSLVKSFAPEADYVGRGVPRSLEGDANDAILNPPDPWARKE